MSYYHQLDSIQIGVYEQLTKLVQTQDAKDQSQLVLSIASLLTTFQDYLAIIKTRDDDLYDIYANKLNNLRQKVRDVQVKRNEVEGERIHQQRLQKYGTVAVEDESDARDKLFGARGPAKDKLTVDQQILSHNKQITSSLQATRQLLSATVLQSELNIDSLDQQTKDLHKLNDEFVRFNDLLNKSRQIVKFIEKQDKLDKRRIYLSIAFFALCCAWVIWKRILRLPVRMLLWSFFRVFGIVGWLFGGKSGIAIVSPVESPSLNIYATVSEIMDTTTAKDVSTFSDISSVSDISFSDSLSISSIYSEDSTTTSTTVRFDIESDYVIDVEASTETERLVDEL